ncbi:MAG: DUF1573 domain-containing protein [Planctomycetota bacterium]|nr:DUF1573 domain-containing protein [Planctomycetota bacterium]
MILPALILILYSLEEPKPLELRENFPFEFEIDCGCLASGGHVENNAIIVNRLPHPISFSRIAVSCGCLETKLKSVTPKNDTPITKLGPGESVNLATKLSVGTKPGPFMRSITIEASCGEIKIALLGESIPPISASRVNLSETDEGNFRLKINARNDVSLAGAEFTSSSEDLIVKDYELLGPHEALVECNFRVNQSAVNARTLIAKLADASIHEVPFTIELPFLVRSIPSTIILDYESEVNSFRAMIVGKWVAESDLEEGWVAKLVGKDIQSDELRISMRKINDACVVIKGDFLRVSETEAAGYHSLILTYRGLKKFAVPISVKVKR